MKKQNILIAILGVVLLVNGYLFYEVLQIKKIVMIDAIKLFNEFKMKNELEGMERVKLETMTQRIDSIEKIIKLIQQEKKEVSREMIESYNRSKMILDDEYNTSNKQINEQVWKRLNPLIDNFGKENGYHLIIGANGMGTVLYNDSYLDVTQKAITYINKKYEEGN